MKKKNHSEKDEIYLIAIEHFRKANGYTRKELIRQLHSTAEQYQEEVKDSFIEVYEICQNKERL